MKKWSWNLVCPKCGAGGRGSMHPVWEGEVQISSGFPREFIQVGFSAKCGVCGYQEEVLPLDVEEEE